ncbi:5772_t:CDS:2 [Dentiscutata erythropus]|uniref:5772_t:CDS:1 n=1 Tax=Dentiscutata erythropus TaxID=1348616 RepID=A0A9N9NGC3_9GLOM|nr:5772_t:CDS:2 [Dentiscutata erythropus]
MPNPFEFIRHKVQQHNIKVLAKKCNQVLQDPAIASLVLRVTKKHIDMPAIVIQWNNAGFNDVPTSPNNRNGVIGQDQNAIINFMVANGATNYHNTVFMFRDAPTLSA